MNTENIISELISIKEPIQKIHKTTGFNAGYTDKALYLIDTLINKLKGE